MTVALLKHERTLRWELEEVVPSSASKVTLEMPSGAEIRSFLHQVDVRALVRMRSAREIPIRHRVAAAQLHATSCKVLLATDRNIEFLNSLAELCPEVHQIVVSHGVIVPRLRARLGLTRDFPNRTFCVWSEREVGIVRELAPAELRPVSLGSLRNALYMVSPRRSEASNSNPLNQICLVSSFSGLAYDSQLGNRKGAGRELRQVLLRAVQGLADAWSLPVVVALKPQTMSGFAEGTMQRWADERRYFEESLPSCEVFFSEPQNRFESYQVVDSSLLSVGLFSSPIVEGFGRASLTMSVGLPHLDASWGSLPPEFHLTNRSLLEVEQKSISWLQELRGWLVSDSGINTRRHYLEAAVDGDPIRKVRSMIARHLG